MQQALLFAFTAGISTCRGNGRGQRLFFSTVGQQIYNAGACLSLPFRAVLLFPSRAPVFALALYLCVDLTDVVFQSCDRRSRRLPARLLSNLFSVIVAATPLTTN